MKGNELGIALGICGLGQFERSDEVPISRGTQFQTQPRTGVAISILCYQTMNSPIEPCCH